jgi:hypothetical protein
MGEVIGLPRKGDHVPPSAAKKSGRILERGMPVSFSISKTRFNGTPFSDQRVTVLLFTEQMRARSTGLSPFSARRRERVLMDADSCTTNNGGQGVLLRKPLTTAGPRIGMLPAMPKRSQKPLEGPPIEIYGKRQPGRPHYLAALLEAHNIDRGQLIEDLGVDKGLVSRWLHKTNPSTPSREWTRKLGWYFAAGMEPDDFIDIFTDPALARFQKLTRGRSTDEINRMLNTLEAAFSPKTAKRA